MEKKINQIDEVTKKFVEAFSPLSPEQLNWKTEPASWSIAQNIDHIIILNKSYFQEFKMIELGAYKIPMITRLRYWYSFARNPIKPYMDSDRIKRAKTYEFWDPKGTDYTSDILKDFRARQNEFKKHLEQLARVNRRTLMYYPGDRSFVFTLDTAFDVLIEHEKRHFNQAKEVLVRLQQFQPA